jgi:AraC-like DNA-binding protein
MAQTKADNFTASLIPLSINILLCNYVTLPSWTFDNLSSPFWRLYWNVTEGWSVTFKGNTMLLEPGHVMVIPPFTQFRAQSKKPSTQFYIHFDVESNIAPFNPGVYVLPINDNVKAFISGIKKDATPECSLLNTLKAKYLCYYYLNLLPEESINHVRYSPLVLSTMGIMTQNLERPFSNPALAKVIGMNVNAFIRLFHKETGVSPQKWYLEKRINRASLLLSHTGKSIDEIADKTGFCDRAHLSRVFGKLKKMGAAQYRKQRKHS